MQLSTIPSLSATGMFGELNRVFLFGNHFWLCLTQNELAVLIYIYMSLFSDRSAHLIVYLPSTLVTIIVALFTEDFIVCVCGGGGIS